MSIHINALVTEVGVNMGDHGQDVTRAIPVKPWMTLDEVCETYLTEARAFAPDNTREVKDSWYLTIRIAKEASDD